MDIERVRRDFDRIARLPVQYDSGSSRYDSFIVAAVPPAAIRILDVGCGTGRLLRQLAAAGRDLVGVDVSHGMIARAGERSAGAARVEFLCGDFLQLELRAGDFDCIVSAAALHHMPAGDALRKMRRLLRPGGRLIVQDLRKIDGVADRVASSLVLFAEAAARLVSTGRPWRPRSVRSAWNEHAAGDEYLTAHEAEEMAEQWLPGAHVHVHAGWRYSIIWDKPIEDRTR